MPARTRLGEVQIQNSAPPEQQQLKAVSGLPFSAWVSEGHKALRGNPANTSTFCSKGLGKGGREELPDRHRERGLWRRQRGDSAGKPETGSSPTASNTDQRPCRSGRARNRLKAGRARKGEVEWSPFAGDMRICIKSPG